MDPVLTFLSSILSSLYGFLYQQWMEHPYHILIEGLMIGFSMFILFQKSYRPSKKPEELSEAEIDELCAEWEPEPLLPAGAAPDASSFADLPVLNSGAGPIITVDNKKAINLASLNFLGLSSHPSVVSKSKEALRKYGVGSCGPRGFYGSVDVHVNFEERVKEFMGTEDAILYSYGFATVASAIPTFSKRGDLLVVDDAVNFSVMTGVNLSRSSIKFFKHNDMEDLERVLKGVIDSDAKKKNNKLNRRFIVVEGLYFNTGDIAPLNKIVELKNKYRFRLAMDDSYGIGVLGAKGRGTCEHFGIPSTEVELLTANMEAALGCVGGFCVGTRSNIFHQRLAASGYVFSASLPPFISVAATEALSIVDSDTDRLQRLGANIKAMTTLLADLHPRLTVSSARNLSPIFHVRLTESMVSREEEEALLDGVTQESLKQGVAVTRAKYSVVHELHPPQPSIRITVSSEHAPEDLEKAAAILKRVFAEMLEQGVRDRPSSSRLVDVATS